MAYVNVGAKLGRDDIPTKAALKRSTADEGFALYCTDAFGTNEGKWYRVNDLEIGVRYSVTGPNPYTSRKWYATVEKLANGTIKVS